MKRFLIALGFVVVTGPAQAQFVSFCSTVGPTGPSGCASETTSFLSKVESAIDRASAYAQDTLHLNETIKVFSLATQMSQYIGNASSRWPSTHYSWQPVISSNTFGINSGWQLGNNTGLANLGSLQSPLSVGMIPGVPYQFQGALQQAVASIERHDGLVNGAVGVVGRYMGMSPQLTNSLVQLASSVTGLVSGELTYAAAMQKIAGAQMLGNQSMQMAGEIQQRQLLNQQAMMILQRQAAADEVNAQLYNYTASTGNLTMTQNSSAALYALRIP